MRNGADEGLEVDDADDCDGEPAIDTAEPVDLECPYGGAVSFNVDSSLPRRGPHGRWRRALARGGDGKNSLRWLEEEKTSLLLTIGATRALSLRNYPSNVAEARRFPLLIPAAGSVVLI